MSKTFSFINNDSLVEVISSAERYVIFAAPSISYSVAEAIVQRCHNKSDLRSRIVLDVDSDPMRLGFGEVDALTTLHHNGIEVRHAPGLRIGVVVVDDNAWVF